LTCSEAVTMADQSGTHARLSDTRAALASTDATAAGMGADAPPSLDLMRQSLAKREAQLRAELKASAGLPKHPPTGTGFAKKAGRRPRHSLLSAKLRLIERAKARQEARREKLAPKSVTPPPVIQ
jgi:hypothetical protein